jgi:hypothetical protein
VHLRHRIVGLVGGRRASTAPTLSAGVSAGPAGRAGDQLAGLAADPAGSSVDPAGALLDPAGAQLEGAMLDPAGPGAATAAALAADPCAPAREAVQDSCSLADRMSALALASQDRLRESQKAYNEHAGRRERAAAAADPRAVRAAKDEAQAAFRSSRLAARERPALEAAAREWLREIDRINARTREATRLIAREDLAEAELLHALDRLGIEADGARIAAESAAEACRNARITLATCEERQRVELVPEVAAGATAGLAPASVVARDTHAAGLSAGAPPAPGGTGAGATGEGYDSEEAADASTGDGSVGPPTAAVEPAILPLLAGDRAVMRRLAAALAAGDAAAESTWQIHLAAFVDAVRARAIDAAALTFPGEDPFWGPYTQLQCREISAALAALGYRFDGLGGFADGRVPGQRELSLAIGYAGLDPMRIRIWPNEAELPGLYADVHVDAGRFLAEAAGELTLGDMIDLLGRRAEELSELWNAWGRVRPLLLGPA